MCTRYTYVLYLASNLCLGRLGFGGKIAFILNCSYLGTYLGVIWGGGGKGLLITPRSLTRSETKLGIRNLLTDVHLI